MDEMLEGLIEFISRMGEATQNIEEFIAPLMNLANAADVVREAFGKTWAAVETGARLQGLSSITGESVGKLYEFERGLEAVGRKARYLPTIFADMQRALSDKNWKSDRVQNVFEQLGLNMDQMRDEDTGDAVIQFANALGKQNPNDATELGTKIFGRFQTETILAMARNMDVFEHAMQESSQTAETLEKNSKAFEDIITKRGDINNDALGLQAAAAGQIAYLFDWVYGNASNGGNSGPAAAAPNNINEILANAVPGGRDRELSHFKPEFTWLEKMGFIMSGSKVQNPYEQRQIELLQKIVDNTSQRERPLSITLPDDRHLHDVIDPPGYISNMV